MKKFLIIIASALVLSACSSTGDKQNPAPISDSKGGAVADPNANTGQIKPAEIPGGDLMEPPPGLKLSVYFDLDSFVIKDEFRPVVESHAAFLKKNPRARTVIEGNTDERGSREYNLALGQKRAEAVKSMLRVLGVPETQVEAVSFGEERPKAAGHDETAYAENRRSDFSYRK
jgi:peptidoglycan-associated lipoprotein